MAGTIVSDVLQDGSGNSTATTNAIQGSAKAWVNFSYQITNSLVINKSYNISSVTRNAQGNYTYTFTNNMADANYAVVSCMSESSNTGNVFGMVFCNGSGSPYYQAPTTSRFSVVQVVAANTTALDTYYTCTVVYD